MWKFSTLFSKICNIPGNVDPCSHDSSGSVLPCLILLIHFHRVAAVLSSHLYVVVYCSPTLNSCILCAAAPSGGLIIEQELYAAFRFALLTALLFPSQLILSSVLIVWGYLGRPILCLMSSETKISIFGHGMMILIMGRDQLPEWWQWDEYLVAGSVSTSQSRTASTDKQVHLVMGTGQNHLFLTSKNFISPPLAAATVAFL